MKRVAKKVAFINGKGGVGKTTSVFNVASMIGVKKREKVLVIDADKQRNTTSLFTLNVSEEEQPKKTLMDFLKGEEAGACVCKTYLKSRDNAKPKYYGIDCMVAGVELADESNYADVDFEAVKERFDKFVESEGYDWVLVDMPPSNRELNKAVFGCMVDYVIVPFSSDNFSIDGYGDIMDEVEQGRQYNPNIGILGVYLARYIAEWSNNQWAKSQIEGFKEYLDVQIPFCAEIGDGVLLGKPACFSNSLFSKAKPAYEKLIKEMERKIEGEKIARK